MIVENVWKILSAVDIKDKSSRTSRILKRQAYLNVTDD